MLLRISIATALLFGVTAGYQATSTNSPQQPAPMKPSPTSQSARNTGQQNGSANALVKATVQNELNAIDNDHTHWMYLTNTRKNGVMETEEQVETPHGDVTRLIARNGEPLTPDEQKQADEKTQQFVSDAAAQQKQRHDLDQDAHKTHDLLAMLPDALTYTYAGRQGGRTRLTFKPNPDFHPPSREAKVFHAMQGQMLIDTKERRLVEFSGHLTRPVKFGGGLLGDLDAGGSFDVRQQQVGPGHWEISLLRVNMKGKALIFKTISVHQDESHSHFKRVPDDLTVAQAYDLAKKQPTPSAKSQSGD